MSSFKEINLADIQQENSLTAWGIFFLLCEFHTQFWTQRACWYGLDHRAIINNSNEEEAKHFCFALQELALAHEHTFNMSQRNFGTLIPKRINNTYTTIHTSSTDFIEKNIIELDDSMHTVIITRSNKYGVMFRIKFNPSQYFRTEAHNCIEFIWVNKGATVRDYSQLAMYVKTVFNVSYTYIRSILAKYEPQ